MAVSYSLSFVRAALVQESVLVAQTYRDDPSWDNVRAAVRHDNLLQARTVTSGNRIFSEIHKQLSLLNAEQIELMTEANDHDVRQLIWVAIWKQSITKQLGVSQSRSRVHTAQSNHQINSCYEDNR